MTCKLGLLIFGCILFFNTVYADSSPPKNPNSAKGCALCHYRWIDTFFVQGKGSDLVDYHSEKVAASADMCYSCHDGSVMDSRVKDVNNLGHKTDISPPSSMKIPKIFPLDEDGKMQCSTCHTAHGVPSRPGSDSSLFMRTKNEKAQMCIACHTDMAGGKKKGQHPLKKTGKDIEKKQEITCKNCHFAHGSKYEAFLSVNPAKSGFCLSCHPDKYFISDTGKRKPFHIVNIKPVKAKISEKLIAKGAKLDKNGEIVCQTCHKVHKNKTGKSLLILKNDAKSGLCLTCHIDKKYIANTKHNLSNTAPKEKNLQGTTVKETGICSACHLPHKPARQLSGQKDITTKICVSCHSKGNVAGKVNLSGQNHPLKINPFKQRNNSITKISIKKETLSLPLFNKFGVEDPDGDMICITCHATHGSRVKEDGQPQNKYFLRKKTPLVCRECHVEKFAIIDTRHNLKKTAPMEKNILGQTALDSGLCGSCHLVHGSQKGFLWARKIEPGKIKGSQQLCTSCHNEHGIAKKKVNKGFSHPLKIDGTDKIIGSDLPLFREDGTFSPKGNLRCYTCHDPHTPKIRNKKPTLSFLRKNPPGLCKNCHNDKFSIKGSKHDMPDPEKNSSMLCKTCHLVHNAYNSFLWAQKDIQADFCQGCHYKEGSARQKVLKGISHPVNIPVAGRKVLTNLPLYKKSGEVSKNGQIKCYTCHNPHNGKVNNFLRRDNSMSPQLCNECHNDKGYVVNTDHDLRLTSYNSTNIIGQTPRQSGVCGVCHLVHNGVNKNVLWAQKLGQGDSMPEKECTSCHRKDQSAENKIPQISTHPENQHIKNIGRNIKGTPEFFPVFSSKTGKPADTGDLSCSSCHNVHQWSYRADMKNNKINLEGNALNSFLRPRAATKICRDCHGPDSLFRFKYFHKNKTRKTKRD
ncbi:MAG: cytochrome c3 family protein [Desulfobacula sp.]|nr:cytochrome c3 family protein [Desulfobacula sp.]